MTTTVLVSKEGELVLPREALDALGIDADTELLLDVDAEEGWLTLRTDAAMGDAAEDDEWLYTPENIESHQRIMAALKDGTLRTDRLSEADLRALAPVDDD